MPATSVHARIMRERSRIVKHAVQRAVKHNPALSPLCLICAVGGVLIWVRLWQQAYPGPTREARWPRRGRVPYERLGPLREVGQCASLLGRSRPFLVHDRRKPSSCANSTGGAMSKENIDYKAVIVDIERNRAAMNAKFDVAIAAIRQIIGISGTDHQQALHSLPSLPTAEFANKPYRDLGMVDAAKHHLSIAKRHVPNVELAAALVSGGFPHKSKNFPNTLNSVLWRRAKTVGDITKSKHGWGLSEWKRGLSLRPSEATNDKQVAGA